jgi:hypothetical protein
MDGLVLTRAELPLLAPVCRLVVLLDSSRDVAALAPFLPRKITYRVLNSAQGTRLREIAAAAAHPFRLQ